jgi:hypothetical protein
MRHEWCNAQMNCNNKKSSAKMKETKGNVQFFEMKNWDYLGDVNVMSMCFSFLV